MLKSQCWLISSLEIWGGAESIYFEIWGAVAPRPPAYGFASPQKDSAKTN